MTGELFGGRVRGNIGALLTPFTADGRVDLQAMESQLAFVAPEDVLALSVLAVEVQDYHVLDEAQRAEIVGQVVARTGVPVVAGVSHAGLATSCELARAMADAGASAVLAVASRKPWGTPPTSDEARRWFETLAEASPVPLVLYNNPAAGVDLPVDTIREICAHPNVVAIKETSRNVAKMLGLCTTIDLAGLAAVFTNMESLHATLNAGGRGAMLPPPGIALAAEIVRAVEAGDVATASRLQAFFVDFPGRWMRLGLGPVMKAAMEALSCPVGPPLPPYDALLRHELEEIRQHFSDSPATSRPNGAPGPTDR